VQNGFNSLFIMLYVAIKTVLLCLNYSMYMYLNFSTAVYPCMFLSFSDGTLRHMTFDLLPFNLNPLPFPLI